jgi:hypothetical protein
MEAHRASYNSRMIAIKTSVMRQTLAAMRPLKQF